MDIPKALINSVLNIVRESRNISLPNWGKAHVLDRKSNRSSDIVTLVDKNVESFLSKKLSAIDPSISFVGEEYGGDRASARMWLVDPIDGTGHYIRGIPYCTTMVALIVDNVVEFGVIFDFVNNLIYYAVRGNGAYVNDEPILIKNRPIKNPYICYESKIEKTHNLKKYLRLRKRGITPIQTISSGYEHILLATGKIEARVCYEPYGYDYDYAPGVLIAKEAGCLVTNIGKSTYDYRNLDYIAATPNMHAFLTEGNNPIFPNVE